MSTAWQERSTDVSLSGEAHIDVYLNPTHKAVGCGFKSHADDCLCDVDLALTEKMEWDNAPRVLHEVETAEDVVRAGAWVWQNYDVGCIPRHGFYEDGVTSKPATEVVVNLPPEDIERLVGLVRNRVPYHIIHEMETYNKVTKGEYTFMVRALDNSRSPGMAKPIPLDKVIELHNQGLRPFEIAKRIETIIHRETHPGSIGRLLRTNGIVPNRPPPGVSGRPSGWTPDCGLAYDEFRRVHDADEAVA